MDFRVFVGRVAVHRPRHRGQNVTGHAHVLPGPNRSDEHVLGPDAKPGVLIGRQVGRETDTPRARKRGAGHRSGHHPLLRRRPRSRADFERLGVPRQHPCHVGFGPFRPHLQRRVAVVAAADGDEVLAAFDARWPDSPFPARCRRLSRAPRPGHQRQELERKCSCSWPVSSDNPNKSALNSASPPAGPSDRPRLLTGNASTGPNPRNGSACQGLAGGSVGAPRQARSGPRHHERRRGDDLVHSASADKRLPPCRREKDRQPCRRTPLEGQGDTVTRICVFRPVTSNGGWGTFTRWSRQEPNLQARHEHQASSNFMGHIAVVAANVIACLGLLALTRHRLMRARRQRGINVGTLSQQWRSEQAKEPRD